MTRVNKKGDQSPNKKFAFSFGNTGNKSYLCSRKNEINMATILSNVSDESLLTQLKKVCQMLKGVVSVKVQKSAKEHDVFRLLATKRRWPMFKTAVRLIMNP